MFLIASLDVDFEYLAKVGTLSEWRGWVMWDLRGHVLR